jgi:hypothetical protein
MFDAIREQGDTGRNAASVLRTAPARGTGESPGRTPTRRSRLRQAKPRGPANRVLHAESQDAFDADFAHFPSSAARPTPTGSRCLAPNGSLAAAQSQLTLAWSNGFGGQNIALLVTQGLIQTQTGNRIMPSMGIDSWSQCAPVSLDGGQYFV